METRLCHALVSNADQINQIEYRLNLALRINENKFTLILNN